MREADSASVPPSEAAPAGRRQRRKRTSWLGRLVALAFGLALVALAELGLHLADYDGPTRMFVKIADGDGTESYVTNFNAFRATFVSNPVIRAQRLRKTGHRQGSRSGGMGRSHRCPLHHIVVCRSAAVI